MMLQDDSPPPPPSKEEIAEAYQGSKEEFLRWRAKELALVAKETAEVKAEIRDYETRIRKEQEASHLHVIP